MNAITELTRGQWPQILAQQGIPPTVLNKRHQACPFCGGEDRFRFTDWRGEGRYICTGCGNGSGMDLLMRWHGWNYGTLKRELEQTIGVRLVTDKKPEQDKPDPRIRLRVVQSELLPPDGKDPVSRYLRARGLRKIPPVVRYHPNLAYYIDGEKLGNYPAMAALVHSKKGEPITYHVTYLDPDEPKKLQVPAPRKTLPPLGGTTAGGAIRLYALVGKHLKVAEGIETALAVHDDQGGTVWALKDTAGMKNFEPPKEVDQVTIYADNDPHFAGQVAAYTLAHRLVIIDRLKPENVKVEVYGQPGQDYLDYYQKSCEAGDGS
jgi:putative DNA primase/helicase